MSNANFNNPPYSDLEFNKFGSVKKDIIVNNSEITNNLIYRGVPQSGYIKTLKPAILPKKLKSGEFGIAREGKANVVRVTNNLVFRNTQQGSRVIGTGGRSVSRQNNLNTALVTKTLLYRKNVLV